MPTINYITESERFQDYAMAEGLTPNEQALWHCLFSYMNRHAHGHNWPDGFVKIPNNYIFAHTNICFDTMAKARNKLKQRGLIDYINGEKQKTNPAYKLFYFCPVYEKPEPGQIGGEATGGADDGSGAPSTFYPQIYQQSFPQLFPCCPKISDKEGDKEGDKQGGKQGGKQGDIYINRQDDIDTVSETCIGSPEEDDDVTGSISSRTGAGEGRTWPDKEDQDAQRAIEINMRLTAWRELFGKRAGDVLALCGVYRPTLVEEAIFRTVQKSAFRQMRNPYGYLAQILRRWESAGVESLEDAQEERELYMNGEIE